MNSLNLCDVTYKLSVNENDYMYNVINEPNFKYDVELIEAESLGDNKVELIFNEYLEYNGEYYDKYNYFNLEDNSEPITYKLTARRMNSTTVDVAQILNKGYVKVYAHNTYITLYVKEDEYKHFKYNIVNDTYKNLADYISYETIFNQINLEKRLSNAIWFYAKVAIDETINS